MKGMAFDFDKVAAALAGRVARKTWSRRYSPPSPLSSSPMLHPAGPATCWVVKGGTDQTLIADGSCSTKEGLDGVPTSTVKIPEDVLLAMFKGEMTPRKSS